MSASRVDTLLTTALLMNDSGKDPVMKASFIGEFYPDEEEKSETEEMLNTTVMR